MLSEPTVESFARRPTSNPATTTPTTENSAAPECVEEFEHSRRFPNCVAEFHMREQAEVMTEKDWKEVAAGIRGVNVSGVTSPCSSAA